MVLVDHLQKTKKEYKNVKKQEIHDIIIKMSQTKAYGDFKDLTRRTASNKILRDKAFKVAKNSECDGYQRGLISMVFKVLIKKLLLRVYGQIPKQRPIIRKLKNRKVH